MHAVRASAREVAGRVMALVYRGRWVIVEVGKRICRQLSHLWRAGGGLAIAAVRWVQGLRAWLSLRRFEVENARRSGLVRFFNRISGLAILTSVYYDILTTK